MSSSLNKIQSSSVLELMKSVFKKKKNKNKAKRTSENKTNLDATGAIPKSIEVIDKNKILTEFEQLKLVYQNWMKISTPSFRDKNKYPTLSLNDYSEKNLNIDSNNFRINESFSSSKNGPEYPPNDLYFWFSVNDKNLYYTDNKTSLIVRGNLPLKKLKGVSKERKTDSTCFEVFDSDNTKWKLCAEDQKTRHNWICYLHTILGNDDFECKNDKIDTNVVVEDTKVTDPVILIPLPSKTCNENWNYNNQGKDWNCDCSEGKTQSPIDIKTDQVFNSRVKPVFYYKEFTPENKQDTFVFKDNTIRLQSNNLGRVVTLDGNSFKAKEIVFHTPSQHKIDGKFYDMEMEVIHEGESPDVIAEHLTLSILFEATPGVYNKFLDDLDFFNLPGPTQRKKNLKSKINLNKIFYEIQSTSYPNWEEFSFFTYEGSLSAPPCTEKTIVYVKKEPIPVGNTTLQLFREAIKIPDVVDDEGNVTLNTSEPTNARQTQLLNGRRIYYYDAEKPIDLDISENDQPQVQKPSGHYEKVKKQMINYLHVTGPQPSGLPNTFVVSEKEAKGLL